MIRWSKVPPIFPSLDRFLIEDACSAENKTTAGEKCKAALERSQQVEQVIPRHQHPPRPLFRRETTEKGQKGTFQQFRPTLGTVGPSAFIYLEIVESVSCEIGQ